MLVHFASFPTQDLITAGRPTGTCSGWRSRTRRTRHGVATGAGHTRHRRPVQRGRAVRADQDRWWRVDSLIRHLERPPLVGGDADTLSVRTTDFCLIAG